MASKLSWAWSEGSWYVVDYAKTGRSTCKEFRCKRKLEIGELRIGIEAPEHDHRGSQLGWYHPSCLWKTFAYKSNANREIRSLDDMSGFATLKECDKQLLKALLEGRNAGDPAAELATSPAASSAARRKVSVKIEGNTMTLSGPTFHIKEDLKKFGAKFNGETKAWVITKKDNDSFEHVQKFLKGEDSEQFGGESSPAKRQRI